ncbi:MAG: hypothetical protein AAF433_12750 [Bacteroidota bacterium]
MKTSCIFFLLTLGYSCWAQDTSASRVDLQLMVGLTQAYVEEDAPDQFGGLDYVLGLSLSPQWSIGRSLEGFAGFGARLFNVSTQRRNMRRRCGPGANDFDNTTLANTSVTLFSFQLPLGLKYYPGRAKNLYLKAGATPSFHISEWERSRLFSCGNDEGSGFPTGDVDPTRFNLFFDAGLGYRFVGTDGKVGYFEAYFSRGTTNLLNEVEPRDAINRENLSVAASAIHFGLLMGIELN